MLPELWDMNKEKGEIVAKAIAGIALATSGYKSKDYFCYRFYNGMYNEDDFDYLRRVRDNSEIYEYPAKVRFIPIIRPKLQYQKSKLALRPLKYAVKSIDTGSLNRKLKTKFDQYLEAMDAKYAEMMVGMENMQQQIQQAMQDPNAQEQMKSQVALLNRQIDVKKLLTQEAIDKIEDTHRYQPMDIVEELGDKLLKKIIQKKDIKKQLLNGFTDKLVSGKELFYVHLNQGEKYPFFKWVNPMNVYWSADEDVEYIHDCRWAAIRYRLTPTQILDNYKTEISMDLLKNLRSMTTSSTANSFIPTRPDGALDGYTNTSMYYGSKTLQGYDVFHVFWKSPRSVYIKKTPNQYTGGMHSHFINENEAETWKKNEQKNKEKGEDLTIRYVNDLWEAIVISGKEVIRCRRCPVQLRDEDYNVRLPIIGYSFNHSTAAPYSLIWATKDIQILYNLINYHRELMLAIAGTKGTVIDDWQRPADMSRKEWMYHKKMGNLFIDSTKPLTAGRSRSSFNQWTTYDETVSPVIAQLTQILESLDNTAAQVTGISRQSTATIAPTDQVGTTNAALQQTEVITEVLFYEHDVLAKLALERYLNLCRVTQKDGSMFSLYDQEFGEEIVQIPKGLFNDVQFELFLETDGTTLKSINELKQIAANAWGRGDLPMEQLVKLYSIDNLKKLEKAMESFSARAQKIQQLNVQQTEDAKKQAALEVKKFDNEYKKLIADEKNKVSLSAQEIQKMMVAIEQEKLRLQKEKDDNEAMLKNKEIESENEIEGAYLREQNRAAQMDEQLRAIEMKLNTLLEEKGMATDHHTKLVEINSKEKIEKHKAKQKEKIKD